MCLPIIFISEHVETRVKQAITRYLSINQDKKKFQSYKK